MDILRGFIDVLLNLIQVTIIFSPLILATVLFVVALISFLRAKNDSVKRKRRKVYLIVASVVLGLVIIAFVALAIMFLIAIRNM